MVTKMIKNYISNRNCIIIAVSKATEDSANSESLKLAREIDREGVRTLGVITQVDLLDESVNILRDYNTLSNKLTLGHTCVYLRPSKSTISIEEQLQKEAAFFRKHEQFAHMADKLGVRSLVRTMNMVLVKHIKSELPTIRESVIYLVELKKNKLSEYGTLEPIKDKKAQGVLVLALLSKYVRFFVEMIEGKYSESREAVIGGARIEHIFSQIFIKSINRPPQEPLPARGGLRDSPQVPDPAPEAAGSRVRPPHPRGTPAHDL
jgi:dynamin 1-like protein